MCNSMRFNLMHSVLFLNLFPVDGMTGTYEENSLYIGQDIWKLSGQTNCDVLRKRSMKHEAKIQFLYLVRNNEAS